MDKVSAVLKVMDKNAIKDKEIGQVEVSLVNAYIKTPQVI